MSRARPQIAEALVSVAVWVCGLTGLLLGVFALFGSRPDMFTPAAITASIGAVGLVQRIRTRPRPLILLMVASTGTFLVVPVVETAGHVVILPVLTMLGSIGVLAMTRRAAVWFALWCAVLSSLSLFWVLSSSEPVELLLAIATLAGVQFAVWKFVSLAEDLLVREEQSHLVALEINRRHLAFEQALALSSRALLMGSGPEALEVALTRLREAIGADRAYLATNVDDPELGRAFHVINSASSPEFGKDEWVGDVIAWSKYESVSETLAAGRTFQHTATEVRGEGWNRSVLTVPVFIEGVWVASVGFVDIGRPTQWGEDAVRMLEVAAPILGTFWEREVTRQQLETLVQSKDRFVASISHELRTPLTAVLGFAEELRSNAGSFRAEELTDMMEVIADQSQELADMVEDLLVSARADIGTVSIRPQDVYLRAQAETVLAAIGETGGKDIVVVGGRGKVWADPSRTRQIIRNLLTNAIRHGGDHVVVEAVEHDGRTVLTVADDGPGLDRSQWDQIFDPYQRAHDIPTQPASIGLGLTVSRQLARLMEGDLVYVANDRGSVFTLTLPAIGQETAEGVGDADQRVSAASAQG